jgi:hypothetical protein
MIWPKDHAYSVFAVRKHQLLLDPDTSLIQDIREPQQIDPRGRQVDEFSLRCTDCYKWLLAATPNDKSVV